MEFRSELVRSTLERFSREDTGEHAAGGIEAGPGPPNPRQPEHRDAPRPDHDGLLRAADDGHPAQPPDHRTGVEIGGDRQSAAAIDDDARALADPAHPRPAKAGRAPIIQKRLPGSFRKAASAAVLSRPSTSFRCGKRPKQAIWSRWRDRKSTRLNSSH